MPLNLSSEAHDVVHGAVLGKLTNEELVASVLGPTGLEGVVAQATKGGHVDLDLIGHSAGGLLTLASWKVTDDANAIALQKSWAKSAALAEIGTIRLLGCNTALRPKARAAIWKLKQRWGKRIQGTTQPIGAQHFGSDGFTASSLLADVLSAPPSPPNALQRLPNGATRNLWLQEFPSYSTGSLTPILADLRRETARELIDATNRFPLSLRPRVGVIDAAAFDAAFSRTIGPVVVAPGLLALPEHEVLAPVPQPFGLPRYRRLTVLLDGVFVRIYPRSAPSGVVCAIAPEGDRALQRMRASARPLRP